MKKIIISFLLVIISFITALQANIAKAYTVYDDVSKFTSLTPIETGVRANIMKGISNPEEIMATPLYQIYIAPIDLGLNGNVTITNRYVYGADTVVFKSIVTYENATLTNISIKAGDELIYELIISPFDTSDITVKVCKEYHPIDVFKRVELDAHMDYNPCLNYNFDGNESQSAYEDFESIPLEDVAFSFLKGGVIKYNSVYEGKDVHMAVEMDNAMPVNELLKNINIDDDTEGPISEYMVLQSNYNPVDRKCPIGAYSLRILTKDSKGNAVIQDISINVIDGKSPSIKVNHISVDYNDTLTEAEVIREITATDSTSDNIQIAVDLSIYNLNKSTIGDYPFSITAKDKYGNTTTKTDYIHVVDKTAPVIIVKDIVVNHPYALMSDDEIKSKLSIIDEIDGVVPNSSIVIEDIGGYKINYNKLGQYKMKVIAKDTKNNKSEAELMIIVADNDYPEIIIGSTIVLSKGEAVSREKLIELLKQMGELSAHVEGVKLTSAYFDELNPSGKYDLLVELPDGKTIEYTIAINEDNDYEAPVKPENKDTNLALYVGGGIASAVGIAIAAIFVVVYRKKH